MAGLDAIRANYHFLYLTRLQGSYPLQIRIKTTFGYIVGVTDVIAHKRFFATYFTYFRHGNRFSSKIPKAKTQLLSSLGAATLEIK